MRCQVTLVPSVWSCLLQCFLHPVLPHVLQPRLDRGANCVRALALGDRDDADLMAPSPHRLVPGDGLANPVEAGGQVREFHSLAI